MIKFLLAFLRAFFPIFFKSKLDDPTVISLEDILKMYPKVHRRRAFVIPYKTNGASRKKKSNRLRISKMTRNKHR